MIPNKGPANVTGHCECRCKALKEYGQFSNLVKELRQLADTGYKTEDHDYCVGMAAMEEILDRFEGVTKGVSDGAR